MNAARLIFADMENSLRAEDEKVTSQLIQDVPCSVAVIRIALIVTCLVTFAAVAKAQVLGDPVDVSQDFQKLENLYFIGSKVANFDPATGQGTLQWNRYVRSTTL